MIQLIERILRMQHPVTDLRCSRANTAAENLDVATILRFVSPLHALVSIKKSAVSRPLSFENL